MSYFKDIDIWLDELLAAFGAGGAGIGDIKQEIKDKLLESYRNGQAAQKPRDEAPREGNPRPALPAWRPKRQR